MSRQARLIAILAVMAVLAVVALGMMAERYSRIAPRDGGRGADTPQAARAAETQVLAFVRVRSALRTTLQGAGLDQMDEQARRLTFAKARDGARAAVGMDRADYREMVGHYTLWRETPERLDPVWRTALERHEGALAGCDLGGLELLDR